MFYRSAFHLEIMRSEDCFVLLHCLVVEWHYESMSSLAAATSAPDASPHLGVEARLLDP